MTSIRHGTTALYKAGHCTVLFPLSSLILKSARPGSGAKKKGGRVCVIIVVSNFLLYLTYTSGSGKQNTWYALELQRS